MLVRVSSGFVSCKQAGTDLLVFTATDYDLVVHELEVFAKDDEANIRVYRTSDTVGTSLTTIALTPAGGRRTPATFGAWKGVNAVAAISPTNEELWIETRAEIDTNWKHVESSKAFRVNVGESLVVKVSTDSDDKECSASALVEVLEI